MRIGRLFEENPKRWRIHFKSTLPTITSLDKYSGRYRELKTIIQAFNSGQI